MKTFLDALLNAGGKRGKIPLQQWSGIKKKSLNCQFTPARHAQVSIETLAANRNKSGRCTGALAASVRESERWNSVTTFLRGGSNFFFFPRKVEERRGRESNTSNDGCASPACLAAWLTEIGAAWQHTRARSHSQMCPPPPVLFFFLRRCVELAGFLQEYTQASFYCTTRTSAHANPRCPPARTTFHLLHTGSSELLLFWQEVFLFFFSFSPFRAAQLACERLLLNHSAWYIIMCGWGLRSRRRVSFQIAKQMWRQWKRALSFPPSQHSLNIFLLACACREFTSLVGCSLLLSLTHLLTPPKCKKWARMRISMKTYK